MVGIRLWKRKYSEHLCFSFVVQRLLEIDLDSERILFTHRCTRFANQRLQEIDLDSETRFSVHLCFRFFLQLKLKTDLEWKKFPNKSHSARNSEYINYILYCYSWNLNGHSRHLNKFISFMYKDKYWMRQKQKIKYQLFKTHLR